MTLRKIECARAAWGAGLLFTPRRMLTSVHRIDLDRRSIGTARVLGARQLAQALLSGADPSPEILALGVWVDVAHAASALGLAGLDRDRAHAGLTDGTAAAVWALTGLHDLRNAPVTAPTHDRRRDAMARRVLGWLPGGRPLLRTALSRRAERRP